MADPSETSDISRPLVAVIIGSKSDWETMRHAAEMLATAREDAQRLQADAQVKLAEQIQRRGALAEQRIATAEAQAAADVKAAAADLAAQLAEQVLVQRLAGTTIDPLIDSAIGQMAAKLQ